MKRRLADEGSRKGRRRVGRAKGVRAEGEGTNSRSLDAQALNSLFGLQYPQLKLGVVLGVIRGW